MQKGIEKSLQDHQEGAPVITKRIEDDSNDMGLSLAEPSTLKMAIGEVVKVEGKALWVQTERQGGGCHSCGAQKTCGTSALAQLFSPNTPLIKVENVLNAKVGDKVSLTLDESDLIKHSLMAYGIPLLMLFVFAGVAQIFLSGGSDWPVMVAGFLGVAVGWMMTKRCYQPVLPDLDQILESK